MPSLSHYLKEYSRNNREGEQSIGLGGLVLCAMYLVQLRGATRFAGELRERRERVYRLKHLRPQHRRDLDRVGLIQWLVIGVVGTATGRLLHATGAEPFSDTGFVYDVIAGGFMIIWGGIYASALVDWYLVLPKVSGIWCPGPCEKSGKQRWSGITSIWAFHRGIARLVVPFVLVGCPTLIGALADGGAGQAVAFVAASLLVVYLVDFEAEGKDACRFALNPRHYIGDPGWLIQERHDSVARVPGYMVDVAGEAAKVQASGDGWLVQPAVRPQARRRRSANRAQAAERPTPGRGPSGAVREQLFRRQLVLLEQRASTSPSRTSKQGPLRRGSSA